MFDEIKKYREAMEKDYMFLHQNPEIGFELKETVKYVEKTLYDVGYTPKRCGKSGVIAEIGEGDILLLRADMDALPLKEEAHIGFASKNGNMHGCGHDMNTSALLGAARYLKDHESALKGKVRLLFQPAEELLLGAKDVIEAGALKDVKGAMMVHVLSGVDMKTGSVIISSPGVTAPAADYFTIEVNGRGCHGSTPEKGIDPINIAAHIIINLQEIHSRELGLSDDAVLTIGSIVTGEGANIIGERVILKGTLRTYDEELREFIKKRLEEIVERTAHVFRGNATVSYDSGCPSLYNDEHMSNIAYLAAKKLLGKENVYDTKGQRGGGSEDFAYISREVPSIMVAIPAGCKKAGYDYPLHHPKVRFDTDALIVASGMYAMVPFEYFS